MVNTLENDTQSLKIFIKKEFSSEQQKLSENICVLLKILTRAVLKNEEHLKISVSEQKLLISLILNKDVRDENGLQYDAERVLVSALTGHIQNYNPSRIKNYTKTFTIEINFSKKTININGKESETDLSSLKKVLECFIKTIVQLTLSGNFFRNSNPNIRPDKEKSPAVSYLNAHDGLLKQLPSGDVKVSIKQDKLFVYFNDNYTLEKYSGILLNAFSLNEKDLFIDESPSALVFSLNDFIKRIDKSAVQYLAINLIDEKTGELLILKRQHNYNSGIEAVGLYCGTGGSAPFPHDPLASIMALISWKLGIKRSELKKIFDKTAPKLMLQENDFASYSCFIPNKLMEVIKKGKGVDNQFYDPKKVQTMHIAEAIKFRENNALLAQQLQVVSSKN